MVSSDSEQSIRRTLGPETSALVSDLNCSASLFGKAPKIRQVLKAAGVPQREAIYIGDETRDAVAARKAGVGLRRRALGLHDAHSARGLRAGRAVREHSGHRPHRRLNPTTPS